MTKRIFIHIATFVSPSPIISSTYQRGLTYANLNLITFKNMNFIICKFKNREFEIVKIKIFYWECLRNMNLTISEFEFSQA